MKKLTLIFALGLGLSTAAFAGHPKSNDAKSDAKTTVKTGDATAYYTYTGPQPATLTQLNDPNNYSNTVIDDPDDLCGEPGNKGCAALFTVGGSGQHTGNPSDIHTKP